MPLGRSPQFRLAVRAIARKAGLRLDIALVHRLGVELALDDHLGLRESRGDVAAAVLQAFGHVGGPLRLRLDPYRILAFVQQRGARLHRLDHVDHMRQHLVFDLDQRQRRLRHRFGGRRHRRHRMAVVEHLLARHHVARDVAEIDHQFAHRRHFIRHFGEIVARHHRLDPGQRQRGRNVDGLDARVSVRAAQYLADQLSGQVVVGAEARAAGHLVDTVGPQRPRADEFEVLLFVLEHGRHDQASRISRAASSTASMIL